jgi:hypothetical protein
MDPPDFDLTPIHVWDTNNMFSSLGEDMEEYTYYDLQKKTQYLNLFVS